MVMALDFRGIVELFGSVADFCAAVNRQDETVRAWIRRDQIPLEHWDVIIRAASARGIRGVDSHTLHAAARIGFSRAQALRKKQEAAAASRRAAERKQAEC
jgi:hypothetical protein